MLVAAHPGERFIETGQRDDGEPGRHERARIATLAGKVVFSAKTNPSASRFPPVHFRRSRSCKAVSARITASLGNRATPL
jgi:hypothetical protein